MKIVSTIFILFLLISCGENRITIQPTTKPLVEAVYSSVVLAPYDVYKVNATISGYLESVTIVEGQLVKKGDVLFTISNQPILLSEKNAALTYQNAQQALLQNESVLDEIKIEMQTARYKMQNDSMQAGRATVLFDKNAISKAERDNLILAYMASKNNVNSLKKRLVRTQNDLQNQVQQAKNNLKASEARSGDYTIRAAYSGKVFQVNKEQGELVSMQEPLAILGYANHFVIKMLIDEVDISKVRINQKVLVTLAAYKNHVFEASITKIAPKMNEQTQTFDIEAVFDKEPANLYMGLTGEGNIIVHEKKKALVIPRDYLLPGNKVETENGFVKVTTGLSNWNYIEILSGIQQNTLLYKPQ